MIDDMQQGSGDDGSGSAARQLARAAAVALGFSLFFVLFFSPVLFTGRLLAPSDDFYQNIPSYLAPTSLWQPRLFAGFPVAGDPQVMTYYPLAALLRRIPGSWNAFMVLAYALAASTMFAYLRGIGARRGAAATGGLVFGLCGFLVWHLRHAQIVHAAAWVPVMLLACERLRAGVSGHHGRWIAALAAAVYCGLTAGHPQIPIWGLVLSGIYALAAARGARDGAVRYLAACLGGVVLGVGLTAVLLLPMAELAAHSVRDEYGWAHFSQYSLDPRHLAALIFPQLFGGSDAPEQGGWSAPEFSGYAGLATLALAAIGAALRRSERVTRFWVGVGIAALVLALGDWTPLLALLHALPILGKLRAPARHLFEWDMALVVLAVRAIPAIEAASGAARERGRRAALVLLPALAAGALTAGARYASAVDAVELLGRREVWQPAIALAAGLWALSMALSRPTRGRLVALAVVAVLDVGWAAGQAEWSLDAPERARLEIPPSLAAMRARLLASGQRLIAAGSVVWTDPVAAPPNLPILWDIPSAGGFNPLILRRVFNLERSGGDEWKEGMPLEEGSQFFDLLGVRIMTMPRPWLGTMPRSRWHEIDHLGDVVILENPRALPRAWLVPRVAAVPPEVALWCVRLGKLPDGTPFDPRALALVEDPYSARERPALPRAVTATVREDGPDALEVDVETPEPAFLVLSEIDYPGWRARIGEIPVPIITTDYILRGMTVPAGRYTIRLEFRPGSVLAGACVSAASLLVWLIALARSFRRRPEKPV